VIAERVADGLYLGIVLALVLVFVPTVHPLPDKVVGLPISIASVRASGFLLLFAFAGAFTTLAVFYFARAWAHRVTLRIVGTVSPKLAARLVGLFERLADGLHAFGRARDALGFLVETTAYWTLNALGIWALAAGCGVVHGDGSAITFVEAAGLMGTLGCAILIPGPPGLLGLFQAGLYAGMTMYYPAAIVIGPGAAFVFLFYMAQVVLTLALGAWGLWHEGGTRRLQGALDTDAPIAAA
jgi:hypothetical protein